MKKEYYWFFMFILAAALVTGSTMSIYANFKYISQQSKLQQQQQDQKRLPEETNNKSTQSEDQVNTAKTKPTAVVDQKLADNGTSDSNNMIISQDEQEELNSMLSAMGSNNEDFSLQIKDFQEKNSLPVTGIMDTDTLNILINKVTLQKAVQHLNN